MPLQALDFGTGAPRDGETLPTAFDKINDMFTELYAAMDFSGTSVGIGTSTPANKLEIVAANASADGPHLRLRTSADAYPQLQVLP